MALTEKQRATISLMRSHGVAYARIARHLELNANSVKTYCLRNNITINPELEQVDDPEGIWCLHCWREISLRKGSKFCSQECRRTWWKHHRTLISQTITCANCGQHVTVASSNKAPRKYCSHPCFIQHRFGTKGGKR